MPYLIATEKMHKQLTTIRLYGKLGAQYGRVHRFYLDSDSIKEAVAAISAQITGFKQELMTAADRGIRYAVFRGKKNISADQLDHPSKEEIRIAPIVQGAKRGGLFQTILGVVMIAVASYMLPGTGLAIGAGGAWGATANIGAAMALGGVIQMLSPQQRGLSVKDRPDNGASYNFNGAVNTSAQGNPVPILYGEMMVGSAVISAGIYTEDQT